jgi:hypothetical protein
MLRGFKTAARRAGLLFGAAACVAAAVAPAGAQSPICADLQSQYVAAFGSTLGSTMGQGQRLVNMDKISRELANVQMAARQGNCNRFLFFGPRPSPQCPAIMATMSRLQQQLAQMRGSRSLFSLSPEQERDRWRGWLFQNGCDIPQPGGHRTICVRTCDGYFFPISFRPASSRFRAMPPSASRCMPRTGRQNSSRTPPTATSPTPSRCPASATATSRTPFFSGRLTSAPVPAN